MIACMDKLLAAVYSVAKNRRPFENTRPSRDVDYDERFPLKRPPAPT